MANLYFISLGCDKNRIDAEIMVQRLLDAGHFVVDDAAKADCAIVNTCGFIDAAKEEAIETIFDMVCEKEQDTLRAVVVTGCLAQRYREQVLEQIPELDAVIGLAHNADICDVVAQALQGARVARFGDPEALVINGKRARSTPPHYAYLKIAEGCSNHCTYCAIPSIRGRFRSRPIDEIVAEAKTLAADGVRELIVIAQDTTRYGEDLEQPATLTELLAELSQIELLWKIRILYAYPDRISDALIEQMAKNPKIAHYLDIPMQHANAAVLRRMGRFGDQKQMLALLTKLRSAMPDITIRSTFIVGFPGETEAQFLELLDFLKIAQLDRAGCFAYSAEEGTPAATLPGQVDDAVKQQRVEQFMFLQTSIMDQKRADLVGKTVEIICDGYDMERGLFACRGEADAPDIDTSIFLPLAADLMPGELYTVRVTGSDGCDLYAALAEE